MGNWNDIPHPACPFCESPSAHVEHLSGVFFRCKVCAKPFQNAASVETVKNRPLGNGVAPTPEGGVSAIGRRGSDST